MTPWREEHVLLTCSTTENLCDPRASHSFSVQHRELGSVRSPDTQAVSTPIKSIFLDVEI